MLRRLTVALTLFALLSSSAPALAQTTPPPQDPQKEEVVRVGASEVKLDVVVRDKKGRVVKDLKASDFEVSEDGVPQTVESFRLVSRGGTTTATETAAGQPAKPAAATPTERRTNMPGDLERVGAVALVFDRLSADSRQLARQAALAFLAGGLGTDDFVGVFRVDLSLQVLQPFTNDEALVRAAVERAVSASSSGFERRAGQIGGVAQTQEQLAAQQSQLESAGVGGASADTGGATAAIGQNATDAAIADMTRRSLETFELLERNQQGFATTNGLLAVTTALGRLPGRKVLVLFSEGLSVPPAVESPFRTLIGNANRAGVSVYAVDAAGLRATSSDAETGRAMAALGQQRIRQAANNRDPNASMMRDLERNEDLLRYNPDSGLGQLAEQTGGFLVHNTNNPAARLRQIDEDLHTYYALSYVPKNQNYDGRFRQVNVKLNRPGLEIQSRKGYYAINSTEVSPVLAYEAPALAILGTGRRAEAFPVHAGAFSFPAPQRPGLASVVVEVPAGAVNYAVDNSKKTYETDFSVVALVKDESQRVVSKLSNQYKLSGPLDRLDAAKRGGVLFYREAELAPGRYTIAAAVYDAKTGRAGTSSASLLVPEPDARGPRLASVVIVKRAERASADDARTGNPFRFGELLVYPCLGEPVSKSATKELVFLLTAYASKGSTAPPELTVEVAQGDHTLGKSKLTPPAPDASGRIQYASSIPVDKLPPGDYELRVTARDSNGTATRSEHFTIQQ